MGRRVRPRFVTEHPPELRTELPEAPEGLGAAGLDAWSYVWSQPWINPKRHRLVVTRYCRIADLLEAGFTEVHRAGVVQLGSAKQLRANPMMLELRLLSTESRLIESELALSPAAENRVGIPKDMPPSSLQLMVGHRKGLISDEDYEEDDFRNGLKPLTGGAAS